jgi:hypothetical protein
MQVAEEFVLEMGTRATDGFLDAERKADDTTHFRILSVKMGSYR